MEKQDGWAVDVMDENDLRLEVKKLQKELHGTLTTIARFATSLVRLRRERDEARTVAKEVMELSRSHRKKYLAYVADFEEHYPWLKGTDNG